MTVPEEEAAANYVPAAAVIPAPRAYINAVAFKKPVVGFEIPPVERGRCRPSGLHR